MYTFQFQFINRILRTKIQRLGVRIDPTHTEIFIQCLQQNTHKLCVDCCNFVRCERNRLTISETFDIAYPYFVIALIESRRSDCIMFQYNTLNIVFNPM